MECVICEKEIFTQRYTLCKLCQRVICYEITCCTSEGTCADSESCQQAQQFNREARRKLLLLRQQKNSCPDCGGPLAEGEGYYKCSRCGNESKIATT